MAENAAATGVAGREPTDGSSMRVLVTDVTVGMLLAVMVVLIVIFGTHAGPTFIYQAF